MFQFDLQGAYKQTCLNSIPYLSYVYFDGYINMDIKDVRVKKVVGLGYYINLVYKARSLAHSLG